MLPGPYGFPAPPTASMVTGFMAFHGMNMCQAEPVGTPRRELQAGKHVCLWHRSSTVMAWDWEARRTTRWNASPTASI